MKTYIQTTLFGKDKIIKSLSLSELEKIKLERFYNKEIKKFIDNKEVFCIINKKTKETIIINKVTQKNNLFKCMLYWEILFLNLNKKTKIPLSYLEKNNKKYIFTSYTTENLKKENVPEYYSVIE